MWRVVAQNRLKSRADRGDLEAVEELAGNLLQGADGYEKDWDRGVELVKVLADSGSAQAMHQMGIFAMIDRDDSLAATYFGTSRQRSVMFRLLNLPVLHI